MVLMCSPRYTQILPKWPLAGQLAGTDFCNTCGGGGGAYLKFWVKVGPLN